MTKSIIRKIRLRTWISIGIIIMLSPILFAAAYGIWGALGGSSATPIAHWAFDEGVDNSCPDGDDACDGSGNGYDMSHNGNITWQASDKCISDKCIYFEGDNDYVHLGDNADFEFGQDEDFTLSMWFKVANFNAQGSYLMTKGAVEAANGNSAGVGYAMNISTANRLVFSLRDESTLIRTAVIGGTTLSANTWYHAAVSLDRDGFATLYLNGKQDSIGDFSARNAGTASDSPFRLGAYATTTTYAEFNGFIDEAKVFDSALSADQVKAEYAGGAAVLGTQDNKDFLSDGLVGYFPMDDNVSGNAQTLTDRSGNGNNATTNDGANDTGMDCTENGKFGFACHFDGTDDYAAIGNISAYKVESKTISFWANPDDAPSATEGVFSGSSANYYVGVTSNSRTITSHSDSGGSQRTTNSNNNALIPGTWHHYTLTWEVSGSNVTIKHYVDGVFNSTTSFTNGYFGTYGTNFIIGAFITSSNFYDGLVDELRIYNRTLSAGEIAQLANWAPGPVGHWKMDDKVSGNGQTIIDSSGNGNNGTTDDGANNTGMNCNDPGRLGSACDLDGTDDYISVGDVAEAEFGTGDFTLMGWIKHTDPSSASADTIFRNRASGGAGTVNGYAFQVHSGAIRLQIDNSDGGSSISTAGTVATDTWQHVAVSVDRDSSTGTKFYLDGVLVGTSDPTAVENSLDNASGLGIGSINGGGTGYFDGNLDDLKIYNYARSSQQIIEDMNGGHPTGGSPVGSQLGYWKFDELQGQTVNNSGHAGSALNGTRGVDTDSDSDDPTWKNQGDCKFNGCLSFDESHTVNLGNRSELKIATKSITFWAKFAEIPGDGEFQAAFYNGLNYYVAFTSLGRMITSHGNTVGSQKATYSALNTISAGSWDHYAFTWDVDGSNVTVRLYKNGNQVGGTTYTDGYSTSYGTSFHIGSTNGSSSFFNGELDEVKFYNSALTTEQIKIDMNQGTSLNFGGGVDGSADTISGAITPPLAHWDMNEKVSGDAQTLIDKSGSGYNLTTSDGANNTGIDCSVPGRYGSSCLFDGTDDYATLANPSFDDFGTGDMSVSAWVKYTSTPSVGYVIIGNKTAGTNNAGFSLEINTTNLAQMRIANGSAQVSSVSSGVTNNDGKWHHLVGVYERGSSDRVLIYVDGRLISTGTAAATGWNISSSQALILGAYGVSANNANMDGNIDDVKIFDYALSPSQVAYEFNQGDPIAWFKFDECSGTTLNDAGALPKTDLTLNIGGSGSNTSAGDCDSSTGTEAWNNGTTGKFGSAMDFDGTDDYAVYSGGPIVDAPLPQVSYSVWVNPDTVTGTQYILEQIFGAIQMSRVNAQWQVTARNSSATIVTVTGGTATAGSWSHVTTVYDGSNVKLYIDGKLITQSAQTGSLFDVSLGFIIGCDGTTGNACVSSTYFDGKLDDMRIYGYALSDEQVKREFNEGKAVRF